MNDLMARLLVEQRKRLVASIMGYAERNVFDRLSVPEQKAFREKVLSAIDVYSDFVRDMIKVGHAETLVNEETLRVIQLVHESQRRLEQSMGR